MNLKAFVWDAQYPFPLWLAGEIRKYQPLCNLQVRFVHTQRMLPFIKEFNGRGDFHALRMDQWTLPYNAFRFLCHYQDLEELSIESKAKWNHFHDVSKAQSLVRPFWGVWWIKELFPLLNKLIVACFKAIRTLLHLLNIREKQC